jgi:hypothetical protein
MPINYTVASDAKPHVSLLLTATAVSIGLWIVGWFLPAAEYLIYPIQLFATFIHESSHALAAFITGNSVLSLTVSPDTSGMVWSQSSGPSGLFISSAGYLGTTLFGILLAIWMRYGLSSRLALFLCSGLIAVMTLVFGFVTPFWNLLSNVTFFSVVFTVASGAVLTAGLFAIAKFASPKWVNFSLAFLAVQCLLNSFLSLKTLFVVTASSDASSDAANMAASTGIPAILWVVLWIIVSVIMMSIGVRLYASRKTTATDSVFVD